MREDSTQFGVWNISSRRRRRSNEMKEIGQVMYEFGKVLARNRHRLAYNGDVSCIDPLKWNKWMAIESTFFHIPLCHLDLVDYWNRSSTLTLSRTMHIWNNHDGRKWNLWVVQSFQPNRPNDYIDYTCSRKWLVQIVVPK